MLSTYKVKDGFRYNAQTGDIITYDTYDGVYSDGTETMYIFRNKNRKDNSIYIHKEKEFKDIIENKLELIDSVINIPTACEPFMFNTKEDLNQFEKGDVVTVTFQNKNFNGKYKGKTVNFVVKDFMPYKYRIQTKRLALVPYEIENNFTEEDITYLDTHDRFECLMIDLFPINRIPYKGWKNKEVGIEINNNLKRERKLDSVLNEEIDL